MSPQAQWRIYAASKLVTTQCRQRAGHAHARLPDSFQAVGTLPQKDEPPMCKRTFGDKAGTYLWLPSVLHPRPIGHETVLLPVRVVPGKALAQQLDALGEGRPQGAAEVARSRADDHLDYARVLLFVPPSAQIGFEVLEGPQLVALFLKGDPESVPPRLVDLVRSDVHGLLRQRHLVNLLDQLRGVLGRLFELKVVPPEVQGQVVL